MTTALIVPSIGSINWGSDVNQNWDILEDLANLLRGYIDGLVLSNNVSDANNDIDVAAGGARDSSNTYSLLLTASLTKRLDAAWVVGTNQGGLDTGSKAASTWYHVFLIRKDVDGTIDALFSASASSPTMPSGWSSYRRIGAVKTNGSSNIIAFSQYGDEFLWKDSILDVNAVTLGSSASLLTLSVPGGLKVWSLFSITVAGGIAHYAIFTSPDMNDNAPNYIGAAGLDVQDNNNEPYNQWRKLRTNSSSQIRGRATGNMTLYVQTRGWIDPRGKDV